MDKKPTYEELEKRVQELEKAENELRVSEEKFRLLYEKNIHGILVVDIETRRFPYANLAFCRMFGYSETEILQIGVEDIHPKDSIDYILSVFRRQKQGENQGAAELPCIHKDGTVFNVDIATTNIVINHRKCVVGFFIDINRRKRIEEELHKSEHKLLIHLQNTSVGAISWDMDFKIDEWNSAAETIFGYTKEEALGKHSAGIILPEDMRGFVDGIFQDLLSGKRGFHSINENITKDGRRIICDWYNTALKDADGKVIGITALVNDITERMQTEEALRESEKKYRNILESIEDGYYEVDLAGNFTFFNNSMCKILGYSKDELTGLNYRQYTDEKNAKEIFKTFNKLYKTGQPYKGIDWELIKKDASRCYVETSVALKRNSKDQPIGFQGIARDISERKKVEKEKISLEKRLVQAQKMESIGRLAGGVAHDYNNALTAIMGFTELAIIDADPEGPLHANLNDVLKAGRRAQDITRQLLAFARKQTIAPKVLDLNDTVESMLKMLRRLIGEDIDLVWLPGMNLWHIRMDPSQIDQILANLCVNAKDAIGSVGKVTIETATTVFDSDYCADHIGFIPGEFVQLSVGDNGCGMDKEILKEIFEPFFTTKDVDKGTGLGLSMVYGIVKQNNGFINVYSEPDKGTTIKVYLPKHEGKAVKIQGESTAKIPQGSGETILVVEDDQPILKLAQKILEGLNYIVLVADTPKGAVKMAQEHTGNIHLLITDVIMPEMNGRELLEQLQSFFPDLKSIFMSGYTANTIAHHGVLDEGVSFVQKPFSKNDLATIVRKVLDEE